MKAWHFVGDTLRDGRPIPADGETLVHDGPLEMCASGMHASVRIIDALQYAPGDTVCRVECGGTIVQGDDKLVCTERTILWRVDAEAMLRDFARRCALDVINLWDAPDVVVEYLRTGDESQRAAAKAAAWAAASAAARAAAWDAACAADRTAAAGAAQNRRLTAMVSAGRAD